MDQFHPERRADRTRRQRRERGARGGRIASVAALAVLAAWGSSGCVTVGDFRREMKDLETRVMREAHSSQGSTELADLSAKVDAQTQEIRALRGRLEVAEKTAADALAEARRARQEIGARGSLPGAAAAGAPPTSTPPVEEETVSAELVAYRAAYSTWREKKYDECIDQFRGFLKDYPSSAYADDAAFWLADCHFQQGDYKNAVLRFDDVVKNYPSGNKAPDALYRQGESLLRLGPGFHEAAKRAFERVVKEYPDSARAPEAQRQIELLAKG